ncbi:FHA domain-containing protein [Streptomyces sp. NPDC093589]|uniref:FHA domain-containing protein n=1 Tax=Streptomyces sp. NPDC093589 TaxID=3366043 RepID=UPI0038139496
MQIRLTVLGPRSGHTTRACDVLVTAPAGTALASVAGALAASVAGAGADTGGGSGPVVLFAGAERLDPQRAAIGEPPLIDGAVLSLQGPGPAPAHGLPHGPARLRVISGPDAGGVHLLHGGQIRIGRSADADVPLDDPDVSRLHCAVTVEPDGSVLVADLHSTNGTAVDGTDLGEQPVPLRPGALLRIGESALALQASPDAPDPVLPATPDGEGQLRIAPEGAGSPAPSDDGAAAARQERTRSDGHHGHDGADGTDGRGGPDRYRAYDEAAPSEPRFAPPGDAGPGAGAWPVPEAGRPDAYQRFPEGRPRHTRPGDTTGTAASGHPGVPGDPGVAARPGMADAPRAPGSWDGPADPYGADVFGADTPPSPGSPVTPASPGSQEPLGSLTDGPSAGGAAGASAVPSPRSAHTARAQQGGPTRRDTPLRGTPAYGGGTGHGTSGVPRPGGPGHPGSPHTGPRHTTAAPGGPAYDDPAPGGPAHRTPAHGTTAPGTPEDGTGPGVRERALGVPAGAQELTHGGQQELAPSEGLARKGGRRGGIGAWARRLAGGRPALEQSADVPAPAPEAPGEGAGGMFPAGAGEAAAAAPSGPAAHERWPDAAAVLLTALGPGPRLWERGQEHPDALTVRLGTASRGGGRAAVPVTVELRRAGSLGLAGPRARLAGLARSAVAQLAALHAPGTLEIVLISTDRSRSTEERVADWSWLGWLPQVRPAHGQDCRLLLAYDKEQAAARTSELVRRLDDGVLGPGWASADRADVASAAARHRGPFTLVIVDGDLGSSALRETAARLAAGGAAAGIHLVCLAETPAASPAFPLTATYEAARRASPAFGECGAVAVLSGDVATALRVVQPGSGPNGTVATVDAVSVAWAERFARALAPLREADATATVGGTTVHRVAVPLPESSRLLDELGLARATPASLMARWAAALDTDRAGAPAVLGAGPHGPLSADLACDGSHLLLEGGAATGKTELLRSLAASLAAADRPDLLSVVLVDGGGSERGEGLRVCTDLPHVTTYLAASDPVRMREFAQALSSELKRRAEILAGTPFAEWRAKHLPAPRIIAQRRTTEGTTGAPAGEQDPMTTRTLRLRSREAEPAADSEAVPMPRLFVLVDDFDALVSPALGSTGRPSAGSVVRALEAIARDGAALGVHLIAATGHPDRTADTATSERAGLRVQLGAASGALDPAEPVPPGRGRLHRAQDGSSTPFQAGRVTGRIPRTSTLRPTVVPLEWQRMGDPPARRPLRELGNGPTDLALLASALQRAAQSSGAASAPPLL